MVFFPIKPIKFVVKKLLRLLSDILCVKLLYLKAYGHFPNLKNPKTFDEKIQWYKLYYRNSIISNLTDKYEVRKYIEHKGYSGILNHLYGLYNNTDEIDFSGLPQSFVLKATHGSGMNIICRDKKKLDWDKCRGLMRKWLKINYYNGSREWAYKNIKPRLICEKYLVNEEFDELLDYKFYCYNGKPEVIFVCTGRFSTEGVRYNAYDMQWNRIYTYKGKPCSDLPIEKPNNFAAMFDIACNLCQGFPFIRVDLYSIKDQIIFGELTFYPDSGLVPFTPDKFNYFFGDFFILPDKLTC
jgi:hypothetical protein